jgi:hypothetical protein
LGVATLGRDRSKRRERAQAEATSTSHASGQLQEEAASKIAVLTSDRHAATEEARRFRAAYEALIEPFTEASIRADALRVRCEALATQAEGRQQALTALAAQVEQSQQALAASETQRQALYRLIQEMRATASWRLTKPLRYAVRLARFLLACATRIIRRLGNSALDQLTYAAAWRRIRFGRPRTMWGVTPILTLPLLARCDRLLGLRSDSLVFTTYYVTSSFDVNLKGLWEKVYANYPRLSGPLHKVILRIALIRYDAFHLFCDRGLVPPTRRMEINEQEMSAIRRYGRRLYTYTYGADVRTRTATLELGRYNLCAECPEPMKFCICDEAEGRGNIARIQGSATAMMAMGDMLAYAPNARNFHYWPIDTKKLHYVGTDWSKERVLRVAHAPNHAHFKGTKYLVAAIERLRSEGRAIELVRVEGVANSEVLALFASCDLVADQFIAGFHGYTALEAMAVGKPVLCYLRDPSMTIDPVICPMINTWPDTIYATLKDCLDGRYDLPALGRRSRAYLEHYYSLEAVAVRLGQLYLATAEFGERINRIISRQMASLESALPALIAGPPPIPWEAAMAINSRLPTSHGENDAEGRWVSPSL